MMSGILGVSNLGEDVNKIRQDIDTKQSVNPPELTEEGYDLSVLPDQGEQDVAKQGSEQEDDIYYDVSNLPDDNPPISQESLNAIWQSKAMFDSYKQSVDADPDNEAKIQSLEKETGLPRWYIEKNPQDAEKRTQQEPDFTAIARDYPTLSKFIMDPVYMAISKDDIETLGRMERIIKAPIVQDINIDKNKILSEQEGYGDPRTRIDFFAVEGRKELIRNFAQFIKAIDDVSKYSNVTEAETGFEFDPIKYYAERGEEQPKNIINMIANAASLQPSTEVQRGEGIQGYIDDLAKMMPQIALQWGTGATAGPAFALAMMFPQIAGSDYENLRNQGISEGRSIISGMIDAAGQLPFELLGLSKMLKMFKSSASMSILIKEIADATGTEALTEWIQQYWQSATELWANTEGWSNKDRAQKFFDDFSQTTAEGMYQGLVAAPFGLAGGSGKILYEFQKARVAERNASRTEAISNLVKESKLAKRDPGAFSELIKKFAPEGQNAAFWPVTAFDSYFQNEADNKAQKLGLSDQLQEAGVTNGSLEIPIEDFATKIASTENVEAIKNDIKYEPDGRTVNEAQQFYKEEMGRQVKEELDRSKEILKQQNEEGKAFQYVVDNVKGQLMANGRDNQSAEDNATLFASGMNAFAKRVGKSITDVFKRVGLQITGEEITPSPFATFDTGYQGEDGPFRGQVSFSDGRTIISLFDNADESTFLHETGHVLYHMLETFAKDENAPQELRDDWELAKGWLLENSDTILRDVKNSLQSQLNKVANEKTRQAIENDLQWLTNNGEDGIADIIDKGRNESSIEKKIWVQANEHLARSFESYLMEGKAPSTRLRKVFKTFKNWFISICRSVANLGVDMDDNIRDVMDRLVATREEIDAMEQQAGFDQAFKENVDKGLADDSYYKIRQEARDKTEGKLLRRKMRPLTKEGKADIAKEKEVSRTRITDEVKADPKYQLYDLLTKTQDEGGFKLNEDALVEEYGEDYVKGLPKQIYSKDGQYTADEVANLVLKPEYTSGDEMLRDMQELKPEKQEIKSRLDAHMQQYIAEMTATNQEMANEAITSDEWLDVLIKEHELLLPEDVRSDKQALKRRQGALRKAAKDSAEAVIANKQARMLKPAQYMAQMQKANREYLKALADEDYTGAREAVERQILNQALANEALKRKRDVDSSRKKFKRLARQKSNTSSIEIGYLDQIKSLLSDINLAHMTDKKRAEMQSRRDFFQKQAKENGEQIYMPDKYINEAFKKPFDEMTVSEIRDVRDVIDNLEHVGRTKKKLITAQDKRQVVDAKNEVLDSINKNNARIFEINRDPHTSILNKAMDKVHSFEGGHRIIEQICQQLDGWEDMGPCWKNIFQRLNKCADKEQTMQLEGSQKLFRILDNYTVKELQHKTYIDKIGMSLSKHDMLCFGLNMGAEGNINRLLENWSGEELEAIKDQLTEKDVQFIRAVWDLNGSYFDEGDSIMRKVSGISMKRVKTVTFRTKFGDFDGGYYTLRYDPRKDSSISNYNQEDDMLIPKREYFGGPAPSRGFSKERAKVVKKKHLLFDIPSVLGGHLQEIIHYISFADESRTVRRLLKDPEIRNAIQETKGQAVLKEMDKWMDDVIHGERPNNGVVDKGVRWIRRNTTFSMIGGKLIIALNQFTSYPLFAEYLGAKNMAMGLLEFLGDPTDIPKKIRFARDSSIEIRTRARTFQSNINDNIGNYFIRDLRNMSEGKFYIPTAIVDLFTVYPGWTKAYNMDFKKTLDHDHAVEYANMVVRNTQPSGREIDRPGMQRGSELSKMVSMFYSYLSKVHGATYRSLARAGRQVEAGHMFKCIPILATTILCSWYLPMMGYALLHGRGPDDDDDKFLWTVKNTAMYPLQSIIGVREMLSYYDPQLSPVGEVLRVGSRLFKELGKIPDNEADYYKITENAVKEVSYLVGGIPGGMITDTIRLIEEYMESDDAELDLTRLFFRDYNKE